MKRTASPSKARPAAAAKSPATQHPIITQSLMDAGILSPRTTSALTSLHRTTIWRLCRQQLFPEPLWLSPGRKGWRRRDVEQWLEARQAVHGRMRPSSKPQADQPKADSGARPRQGAQATASRRRRRR